MKKLLTIFLSTILMAFVANSQQQTAHLSFENIAHNFGTILEENGDVVHQFKFVNTGNSPLILLDVVPSCGCTTPDYPKNTPILPGASGIITVKFNPANRPGPFDKTITVSSNADNNREILRITGKVEKGEQSIEEIYRVGMDQLRLKSRSLSVGNIVPGQVKTETMEAYNNSDEGLKVTFGDIPAHAKLRVEPSIIPPHSAGKITLVFDGGKIQDWGSINNWVKVNLNGNATNHRLVVHGNIEDNFSNMTPEQLAKAPKSQFNETTFLFGTIKQGDVVEHTFVISNTGESDLQIRKVTASCGCTAATPTNNVIKKGESTELKVTFNSSGKSGVQNKAVTVITNDPKNNKQIIWIKGTIETGS